MAVALIPWAARVLVSLLSRYAVQLVVKILVSLGIGITSYSGFNLLTDNITNGVVNNINSLPPEMLQLFGLAKVDVAITIIISAYAVRLSLELTNGAIKKFVLR